MAQLTSTRTESAASNIANSPIGPGTLLGKVALVTGGSRGIGAAIARRLAAAGADVALTYARGADKAHAVAAGIEQTGRRARALAADQTDPAAVSRAVDDTLAAFGRLDILVNNAGIYIGKSFDQYTVDDYVQTMDVNVRAVFFASQAAARHLREGGRIITISSNLAEQVHAPTQTLYSMSKSALTGFTKGLARDLGPRGITVNAVQPGATETDMNPIDGPTANAQRGMMAIQQYANADQIAGLVAYLASPEAQFITGSLLTIDGGTNA